MPEGARLPRAQEINLRPIFIMVIAHYCVSSDHELSISLFIIAFTSLQFLGIVKCSRNYSKLQPLQSHFDNQLKKKRFINNYSG